MTAKHVEKQKIASDPEALVQAVRDRYGSIASAGTSCCGPQVSCCGDPAASTASDIGYTAVDLGILPDGANLGLGCGAPVEALELQEGETVLDLGSGPGIDVLLAAQRVGPSGRVIGVDMTPEMIARARANVASSGIDHVEIREGRLERLPVDEASVDAVTSNCVINLVPDKFAVFQEINRVLRPGGRLVVSDIILDGPLPDAISSDVLAYVGCVAGAMAREKYFGLLEEAGLTSVEILKDVDFLAVVGKSLPAELQQIVDATGVSPDDLQGIVRSVTYRAWKR